MSKERDFDTNPYSPDEARVAKWWCERVGIGGGSDPIGGLIASHEELARQRNEARAEATRLRAENKRLRKALRILIDMFEPVVSVDEN